MGLAQVFEHLLGVGMTTVISFNDYIVALCASLPELYKTDTIELSCAAEPYPVDLDVATTLGIIVTELVNNAYVHGFGASGGKIHVTLQVTPIGAVLSISDNGRGYKEAATTRRGMGLVRRLVAQVGATMTHETGEGTTWTVVLAG